MLSDIGDVGIKQDKTHLIAIKFPESLKIVRSISRENRHVALAVGNAAKMSQVMRNAIPCSSD